LLKTKLYFEGEKMLMYTVLAEDTFKGNIKTILVKYPDFRYSISYDVKLINYHAARSRLGRKIAIHHRKEFEN